MDSAPHGPARCTATNRQGGRCGRLAMVGATVCDLHGGKAPQVRRAAERRLATERARHELELLGEPAGPITDPHDALARICGQAVALVDVLRRHVALAVDVTGPEVGAYIASLRQAESSLSAALRAGIEEREVKLSESQGALLVTVIRAVMAWVIDRLDSGADLASVRDSWPAVAGRELRAIGEMGEAP